ncbi:hypothetical protein GCM10010112_34720 [Actinoplanes lobatus]|uniref:Uncharacterized protein n=1 Tax=Actinoplanes lobatus TaxID=113568 RepID=A0ABQ4AT62_9ACTN|nr:hypothetical protein GCM10010112_34720 [Actinoplanes lobatus]GIE44168.1 hypothetical protein Alo02nite_70660 [Actinoplanes lobatus]
MFVADRLTGLAPECPVTSPVPGSPLLAGVFVVALPAAAVGAALPGARGGPGLGRLRLEEDRRASAWLPSEAFMSESHAGQPP